MECNKNTERKHSKFEKGKCAIREKENKHLRKLKVSELGNATTIWKWIRVSLRKCRNSCSKRNTKQCYLWAMKWNEITEQNTITLKKCNNARSIKKTSNFELEWNKFTRMKHSMYEKVMDRSHKWSMKRKKIDEMIDNKFEKVQ